MAGVPAKTLHDRILAYAIAAMVIIGIMVAALCVPPLYLQMAEAAEQNLVNVAGLKAQSIAEVMERARTLAGQTASRSAIRDALEAYNRDATTLAQYQAFTQDKLADALKMAPDLLGLDRRDRMGVVVNHLGRAIPDPVPDTCLSLDRRGFGDLSQIEAAVVLILCEPIRAKGGGIEGADLILFNAEDIHRIVDDTAKIGASAEVVLGAFPAQAPRRIFLRTWDGPETRGAVRWDDRVAVSGEGLEAPTLITAGNLFSQGHVVVAAPVPGTGWSMLIRVDGAELYAAVNQVMVKVGIGIAIMLAVGSAGLVTLLRPLTGRILIHNTELETQIDELQQTKGSLEQANAELERFADIASHDLQEPTRNIAISVQFLERRFHDKLQGEGHEFLTLTVEAAKRMSAQIQALRDYSSILSPKLKMAPIRTEEAVRRAMVRLAPDIDATGAVIEVGTLPVILANSDHLVLLFQHLLANAINFRHPERAPHITVSADWAEDSRFWCMTVTDNGEGVEPAYLDKIFVIFQRLHARHRYGGTGAGLAICRRIVERMGGRIWADSILDQGTSVHFTVPAAD
jgi:signal transduction histidine kinase